MIRQKRAQQAAGRVVHRSRGIRRFMHPVSGVRLFEKLFCPCLEPLEGRALLATVNWINPGGGNWDTAANWSTGSVPGSGDTAVINTAAAATITV